MSSISWDADFQTGKFEAGVKRMTRSFKEAIKEQKDLIKSLEGDVNNLQKAYNDTTAGKGRSLAGEKVGQAKRALTEERATLLGLQQQQINLNNTEEASQNRVIGTLGKWVMGMFTAVAAWKAFKSIMESTERTSIAFHSAMSGAKSGLDYFMKSIASADFSNFLTGMRDAIKAGSDYTKEMDRIGNISREYKIKEADLNKNIEEQRRIFYEDDKTSFDDKIKAADKMLGYMKQKADMEVDIARKKYIAITELAGKQNKLSEDELNYAIRNFTYVEKTGEAYNRLKGLVDQYNDSKKKGLGIGGDSSKQYVSQGYGLPAQVMTAANVAEYEKAIEKLGNKAPYLGKLIKAFGDVTDAERKAIQTGIVDVKNAENQYNVESKRVYRMQQNMQDQKNKADEEALLLTNKIKVQEDLLTKAIESNNTAQIKAISARIVELKKELEVREKIAKQAIDAAQFEGFVPTGAQTSQLKQPTLGLHTTKKPASETPKQISEEMVNLGGSSENWAKDMRKTIDENDKKNKKALEDQLALRQQIVQAATELVSQIGQQIGLDEKSMTLLNAGLSAFSQLTSGDLPGAAMSMLSGIIAQIPSSASKFAKQIEDINQLLKEQERLITLSEQTGGQEQARKDELSDLEKKAALQKAEYERLQKSADTHWDLLGWRQDKADEANAAWQETVNLIEDANAELADYYTGGTTSASVADAISQGFQDGKTSAADFADTFNGFMTTAINSALEEMSKPAIAEWYAKFAEDMASGGGLSEAEKADLKAQWDKIIAEGEANRQAAYDAAGISSTTGTTSNTGLSGQIAAQMSENTASELSGLFRRFADDERLVRDYSKLGVNHLVSIEANTYGSWQELIKSNATLITIAQNTNKSYSAPLG